MMRAEVTEMVPMAMAMAMMAVEMEQPAELEVAEISSEAVDTGTQKLAEAAGAVAAEVAGLALHRWA